MIITRGYGHQSTRPKTVHILPLSGAVALREFTFSGEIRNAARMIGTIRVSNISIEGVLVVNYKLNGEISSQENLSGEFVR